jgi:hypothetical protein
MWAMSVESEVTFGGCYLLPLTSQLVSISIEWVRIRIDRNWIQWPVLVAMAIKP